QIVGTQAVLNVMTGERYKSITKETAGVLKGEYGTTPAPVNKALQKKVLEEGASPITCRPADLLEPEVETLAEEFRKLATEKGIRVAENEIDDVLIYALFPQVGLKFLENRDNPDAFEPVPGKEEPVAATPQPVASAPVGSGPEAYTVTVDGRSYSVTVDAGGEVETVAPVTATAAPAPAETAGGESVPAPLAGTIFKLSVSTGQAVNAGDVILVMEAMKMETEVRTPRAGTVAAILVKEGDAVQVGDALLMLS
ncbi:MAG: oxaloacetate decarboxylase, partial [Gammaproteobacteria bacterium]|nr:oxaloacetate decarboxylase [Gammaproteobacteria bacterium]